MKNEKDEDSRKSIQNEEMYGYKICENSDR